METANFQFKFATGSGGNSDGNNSHGNTLTVGNVSYRVVGATSTTTTTTSATDSGNNGLQATTVLASPLNGQFYVIGNPTEVVSGSRTIAPRILLDATSQGSTLLTTNTSGTANPRQERRKATHNEVERRRRDNINAWIMKLGRLIPIDEEAGPPKNNVLSKGGILARACDYVVELRDANRELSAKVCRGEVVELENERLHHQLEELKQENMLLREQLDILNKPGNNGHGRNPLMM